MSRVSGDLIPFSSFFGGVVWWFIGVKRRWTQRAADVEDGIRPGDGDTQAIEAQRTWIASGRLFRAFLLRMP